MRTILQKAGITAVMLALLAGTAVLLESTAEPQQYTLTTQMNPSVVDAAQRTFEEEIATFGAEKANERLGFALSNLPLDYQHGYAHQFGKALYDIEGEAGIIGCDVRFSLGCFHQFMSEAIVDMGTDAIPRLYDGCAQITRSRETCEHGLGHGILAAAGYDVKSLGESLVLCGEATGLNSVSGCSGGAFMEYNMRTIGNAENDMGARSVDEGGMYAPCDAIDVQYRRTCTFWLPQWWFHTVLRGDRSQPVDNEAYIQIGRMCEKSYDPKTCYEGLGYITPAAFDYGASSSVAACRSIDTGEQGRAYCQSMAALILHITPESRGQERQACEGTEGKWRDVCLEYASHNGTFDFTMAEPL